MGTREEALVNLRHRHAHYGQLYYDVLRIVSKHDPERLLAMGCPPDEYVSETATILMRLGEATSQDRMRRIVYQELKWWFSSITMSKGQLDDLSRELWEYWQTKNERRR